MLVYPLVGVCPCFFFFFFFYPSFQSGHVNNVSYCLMLVMFVGVMYRSTAGK